MTKNFKAICLGIAFSLSTFAWANPINVEDYVNSKYVNELKEKGLVIAVHNGKDEDFSLIPNCSFTDDCNSKKVSKDSKGFAYTLEYLYLLPKSELLKASNSTKTNINTDDISVVMRSTTKMVSALYYSNTRKKTMPLYKKTYMVDDPVSRNKIEDLNVGSAEGQTYYLLQDDASFGETIYKLQIQQNSKEIFGYFSNMDPMGMAFVKAIKPENLGISIIAIDCEDNIILYMCMDANCKKYPNIEDIMTESLKARMEALKNWLVTMF